jgi:hypothetical protein
MVLWLGAVCKITEMIDSLERKQKKRPFFGAFLFNAEEPY